MNNLATYLKKHRTKHKLTLRELGEASGVGYSHICQLENRRRDPSPEVLRALCTHLGADYQKAVRCVVKDMEARALVKFGVSKEAHG